VRDWSGQDGDAAGKPEFSHPKSRKSRVPVSLAANAAPPTIVRPISPMTNAVAANINKHSATNRMASNKFQSILVSAKHSAASNYQKRTSWSRSAMSAFGGKADIGWRRSNVRREFIIFLGGSAALSPLGSRAQERNRRPKIGIILNYAETDPVGKSRLSALEAQFGKLGWADGTNVEIEVRWVAGKTDLMLAFASQFVSQPVDVIIANSTPMIAVLKQLTSTIPIVFVGVADPIKPGFCEKLWSPGGNITGFTNIEETMGGKWVELLREIAPSIKRASMLINPESANAGANGGLYLKSKPPRVKPVSSWS
jgi:hypothetical protein